MANFIAYYRVSTDKQGMSGLGLEAQQAICQSYVATHGGSIISEYTDVESGKNNNREQLNMAIGELRDKPNAQLIVAKQCRLTRSVSFIASFLEDKGIGSRLVVAESPKASVFELHIRAVLNEETRRQISQNTKNALAAAKARGVQLGAPQSYMSKLQKMGAKAYQQKVHEYNKRMIPILESINANGKLSHREMAKRLNQFNLKTLRGNSFKHYSVNDLLISIRSMKGYKTWSVK